MTDYLKQVLLKEMEQNIKKLIPKLSEITDQTERVFEMLMQNPTSVNHAFLFTLNNLKYIFDQLEPIEQAIEEIQNDEPSCTKSPELEAQLEATLTNLQISKYIAARLNCFDKSMLTANKHRRLPRERRRTVASLKRRLKC